MSMLFKFILVTFIVTAYAVINPSVICHNQCQAHFLNEVNSTNNSEEIENSSLKKNLSPTLKSSSLYPVTPSLAQDFHNSSIKQSVPAHYETNSHIVEGGIEGTGRISDTRKLFEFDNDALKPKLEIQKYNEEGEDGIEGTGRMALGGEHLIAYGPISRFGSIYVNGLKYEMDQADVEFVNEHDINQLSVGMVVKIQAHWKPVGNRNFNAQKVWFDQQLKGPVQAIKVNSNDTELSLLGSLVKIDEDTILDNLTLKNLKVGQVLAVSGIPDTNNNLLATHISRRALELGKNQTVEVESKILAINKRQQRISINNLLIDTRNSSWENTGAGALKIDDLKIGDTIEVIGRLNNNNIEASSIAIKKLSLKIGNKLSLDSVISQYQSDGHFYLGEQQSNASEANFLPGSSISLNNKVRVKANGIINGQGIFMIRTIEVVQPTNATIRATVNSIDANAGEISLLGVTGTTKSGTVFQSKLSPSNKYFSINHISPGDWIELKGKWIDGIFILNRVSAIVSQKKQALKGQITLSDNGKISILGINILTNNLLTNEQVLNLKNGDFLAGKGEMLDAYTFNAASLTLE